MRESQGDLFEQECDAICITTNGMLKLDNRRRVIAVMGAGVARQAAERFPDLSWYFANRIIESGHHTQIIVPSLPPVIQCPWVSLPTKIHWKNPSTIVLVKQSCEELVELANQQNWQDVVLTRPGCGNGGLNWHGQVKLVISKILDDRFTVITPSGASQ